MIKWMASLPMTHFSDGWRTYAKPEATSALVKSIQLIFHWMSQMKRWCGQKGSREDDIFVVIRVLKWTAKWSPRERLPARSQPPVGKIWWSESWYEYIRNFRRFFAEGLRRGGLACSRSTVKIMVILQAAMFHTFVRCIRRVCVWTCWND